METLNRADEWKIEQGLHGAKLPILDQTGRDTVPIYPREWNGKMDKDEEAIKAVGDPKELFTRELEGWKGQVLLYRLFSFSSRTFGITNKNVIRYVEWEKYPEKKAKAHKILTSQTFPPNPEFQLGPIPDTNPVLPGTHWKMWHHALGGELDSVPEDSWATVLREKHPDMLHLLQFPYNGEPPKRLVTSKAITPNPLHFVRNHGGIPLIEKDKWSMTLDGLVANPKSYTLNVLMDESKFPRMEKLVTMQVSSCS
jgi:sulfite oxidase